MISLSAVSVSRSLREGLSAAPLTLRVLAVFRNACILMAPDGRICALVSRHIGAGPLNIVLDAALPQALPPVGAEATITRSRLILGQIEIALGCPDYEPRPDWERLRDRYPLVRRRAAMLLHLARQAATSPGLLALLTSDPPPTPPLARVRQALQALAPGQMWAPETMASVAIRLAGLGCGLTPAGDDWLAGMLLWAWLAHPQPREVGAAVVAAAVPRTNALAAAFLRCAALGECDIAWQELLVALTAEQPDGIEAALASVLAHGATSGADRLAGFLYPLLQPDGGTSSRCDRSPWPVGQDRPTGPIHGRRIP